MVPVTVLLRITGAIMKGTAAVVWLSSSPVDITGGVTAAATTMIGMVGATGVMNVVAPGRERLEIGPRVSAARQAITAGMMSDAIRERRLRHSPPAPGAATLAATVDHRQRLNSNRRSRRTFHSANRILLQSF